MFGELLYIYRFTLTWTKYYLIKISLLYSFLTVHYFIIAHNIGS